MPVFCAITHDENGTLLNTNADTIAYTISAAMSQLIKTKLYYCFEKEGVLKDIDDPDSILLSLTKEEYQTYKDQNIIDGGMIPKLHNSFNAIDEGVSEVLIMHAKNILTERGPKLINGDEGVGK